MNPLKRKIASAVRIAREQGARGVVQAVGRQLGVASLQPGLDEAAIAWDFFRTADGSGVGTMIDVGAHYGGALRPFLTHGWQVHAFEPDQKNRARLLAALGNAPGLHIDNRAVSDQPRTGVTFYRSDQSTGISGLSAFDPSHRAADQIDVTTLSEVVEAKGLMSMDFLKIDTEGHDLFVLRGFPWQRLRPRLVLCEYENHKTEALGYRYEDLAGHLLAQGYSLITSEWHPIERYGVQHRWRAFSEGCPPAIVDPQGWGNVLALRDAADLPLLRAACARAQASELRRKG